MLESSFCIDISFSQISVSLHDAIVECAAIMLNYFTEKSTF